jgi:hypothetical protein
MYFCVRAYLGNVVEAEEGVLLVVGRDALGVLLDEPQHARRRGKPRQPRQLQRQPARRRVHKESQGRRGDVSN